MAQFLEVLGHGEQKSDEINHFYTNIEGNQTVQYVIAEDHQQQFPTQQIVVVDGSQSQSVILNQSQITYQALNQYTIDEGIEFAQREQQVFFMEGTSNQSLQEVVVDQQTVQAVVQPQNIPQQTIIQNTNQQQNQPIVLNHQITSSTKTVAQVVQTPGEVRSTIRLPVQQLRPNQPGSQIKVQQRLQPPRLHLLNQQQRPQIAQQPRPRGVMNQQRPNQSSASPLQPTFRQQTPVNSQLAKVDESLKVSEQQQAVALPDGTIVSVAAYKRILAEQKNKISLQQQQQQQQQQQRIGNTSTVAGPTNQPDSLQSQNQPAPANKKRPSNSNRANRGGRGSNRGNKGGIGRGAVNNASPSNEQSTSSTPGRFTQTPQQSQPAQSLQQQFEDQVVPRQYQAQHQRNILHQQRNQMVQQQHRVMAPQRSQANYVIQPPNHQRPQQQRPLPSYIPSSQIQQIIENTPVSEEYSDSIRMLVLLANGEQRLITFTLPKEACTIQEILEQVNVPFQQDTNIQVTEANTNGINYIVTVGDVPQFSYQEENNETEEAIQQQVQQNTISQPQQLQQQSVPVSAAPIVPTEPPKVPSPEPVKELPKYIPGKLALCKNCGYLSEDFNKCTRCNRKLPEDVKAIPTKVTTNGKQTDIRSPLNEKKLAALKTSNGSPQATPKPATTPTPKKKGKAKAVEHDTVCLVSSDEEEDDSKTPVKSVNEQLLSKLGASISISPVTKEPSLNDIQKHVLNKFNGVISNPDLSKQVNMNLECRTVRIGSYRFIPAEKVLIESTGFTIKVPHPKKELNFKIVRIEQCDIVRVLINFNKSLPVIFYYLTPTVGATVRELLGMEKGIDPYFNPLSEKDESHKRITLLPEEFTEEEKHILQQIYSGPPHNILDELSGKEANDILVKTCPKDLSKSHINTGNLTEIKTILSYPPEGKGRLTINTEDYVCLATDQFLNDVIIDFYLRYLVDNLPKEVQDKVHVFSTFFYKRLTTKPQKASRKCQPAELDNTLTAAQKRHARVRTWTKTVNLFEKDFVIVPINENAHWFLAIICFPGMDGCHTFDGQPYKLEPKSPRKKKDTTAPVKEKPPMVVCEDSEISDKDEAEGEESDMDSDDSDTSTPSSTQSVPIATVAPSPTKPPKVERPPIKQPCILIFDSLAGNCRSRVVATLRDYLTCEYKVKLEKERIYNKDVIKGSNIKVPQQNNFTDCGLYLLQYVEQFFKDPIVDYNIPIKQLKNWFDEIVVTRKREEISELIKNLMMEYDCDLGLLPKVKFPTLNGKIVEIGPEDTENEEDFFEDPEDSSFEDEDMEREAGEISTTPDTTFNQEAETSTSISDTLANSFKPSNESVKDEQFNQSGTSVLKPDISEFPRQTTNKDTLNYLKAKRIIRHKFGEGPDAKKSKNE